MPSNDSERRIFRGMTSVAGSGKNKKSTEKSKPDDAVGSDAVEITEPTHDAVVVEEIPKESDSAPEGTDPTGPSDTPSDAQQDEAPSTLPSPTTSVKPRRRGGFLGFLLGGLLAGALGFAAAQYFGNDRWPFNNGISAAEELATVVAAQSTRIDTLEGDAARLSQTVSAQPGSDVTNALQAAQDDATQAIDRLSGMLATLDQRISDLEMRPLPDGSASADAVAAYKRELDAMRTMFQQELDRVKAAQTQADQAQTGAAEIARKAAIRDAMTQIDAAAGSGRPFGAALTSLKDAGLTVPDALSALADRGIVTLVKLQAEFPDAARKALAAATRVEAQNGTTSKLTAFLRTKLGARSLEPRKGSDADAVLSRAQAALRNGDPNAALAEIEALPPAGLAPMQEWIDLARERVAAVAAIAELRARLNEQDLK